MYDFLPYLGEVIVISVVMGSIYVSMLASKQAKASIKLDSIEVIEKRLYDS